MRKERRECVHALRQVEMRQDAARGHGVAEEDSAGAASGKSGSSDPVFVIARAPDHPHHGISSRSRESREETRVPSLGERTEDRSATDFVAALCRVVQNSLATSIAGGHSNLAMNALRR